MPRNTRGRLLVLTSIVFAATLLAQAPYIIFGSVKLPDGSPALRVIVRISGSSGLNRQVFADDSGRYEIANIPRGRYQLAAVNPSDPNQTTDPAEVDLGRNMGARVLVNLFFRSNPAIEKSKESQAGMVSVAEEAQQVPKGAQKAYSKALALRSDQKYEQALKSFNDAVRAFPDFFQAITDRGHLRIAMNQPAEAAGDFARALEINPRYGPALRGAGLCEFQQGRYEEAIVHLEKAADAEPANATTQLFLGAANLAINRGDQARAHLEKALAIDPVGAARAHVHIANLLIRENKPEQAAKEIKSYLESVPNAPDAEKLRALLTQLQVKTK